MQSGPKQLRDWMERRGFTHREAAEYLDFHQPEVSMFLSRSRTPGLEKAIHIERLTGIPVEAWTLTDDDESSDDRQPVSAKPRDTQA